MMAIKCRNKFKLKYTNCGDGTNAKLICTLHLIVFEDNMKKDEMDRAVTRMVGKSA
jgi:hypothetical protein